MRAPPALAVLFFPDCLQRQVAKLYRTELVSAHCYFHLEVPSIMRRFLPTLTLAAVCALTLGALPSFAAVHTDSTKKTATTTKIKASSTSVKPGQKVTLTVTVTPSKATGSISLYGGIAPGKPTEFLAKHALVNGVAKGTETVPSTFAGATVVLKAVYTGSSKYATSTSNTISIKVAK